MMTSTHYYDAELKQRHPGVPFEPKKSGDVGHDLYAMIDDHPLGRIDRLVSKIAKWPCMLVWPFGTKTVASGVYVNQKDYLWCHVTSRSSAAKRGLMVIGGIIDSGYQGELFTVLYNFSLRPRLVRHGERYSQVIFHSAVRPKFKRVLSFSTQSTRGETGFGSSGN